MKKEIQKYLDNPEVEMVVAIGISHGSVVLYAALLKLLMDWKLPTISKLHVVSIGSPRFIPSTLLPPSSHAPRILNFYHVEDPIVSKLRFVPSIKPFVPSLPKPYQVPDTTGYLYDEDAGIVFMKYKNAQGTYIGAHKFDNRTRLVIDDLKPFQKYHASYFIVCPILHTKHIIRLYYNYNMGPYFAGETLCDSQVVVGGGKKQVMLLSNKKTYRVQADANGAFIRSSQKVYLSTIRGKYRYVHAATPVRTEDLSRVKRA